MATLQPVRGTRDLFEDDVYQHLHIIQTSLKIAENYGFKPIETPIFESTSVFQKTLGETSDIVGKEMYTFEDRGGEFITLRPEGTASVVRSIISGKLTQQMPQKRIYWGPMFRYERPQKGRFRQFYQMGIEYIGVNHPFSDVECIALAHNIIQKLGVKDYSLHLNTLGDMDSRLRHRNSLVEYFSRYESSLSKDSQVRLKKNPLRILDSKDPGDQNIAIDAPKLKHYLTSDSLSFFEKVCSSLDTLGITYHLDENLVRGLDYYCHTSFEFKTSHLGAQSAFLGGGRYDGLMQQMGAGSSIPAVGWALGMDRLALLMNHSTQNQYPVACVLPVGDSDFNVAFEICQILRSNGLKIEMSYAHNLNKRFKQADKSKALYAIVVGSDEVSQGCVNVKELHANNNYKNKEKLVPINQLTNFFRKI